MDSLIEKLSLELKHNPNNAANYYDRGILYKNVFNDHMSLKSLYQAGLIYIKENNKEEAYKCIESMKTIDPSSNQIENLIFKL